MVEKTKEQLLAEAEAREKNLRIEQEVTTTLEDQLKLEGDILNSQREQAKLKRDLGQISKEEYAEKLKALNDELELLKAQNEEIEKQKSLQKEVLDTIGSIGAKYENTIIDKIAQSGVTIGQLGEAFKKNFSIDRLAGSAFDKFQESMMLTVGTMLSVRSEFARATGAGNSFDAVIGNVGVGSQSFGVGMADAAQAVQALHSNMSGFTSMNKTAQESLARTAAELESVGIGADITAAQMDYATRIMGMNGTQAAEQAQDLSNFAMNAGIAPAKMAQEFAAAGPQLAKYGKNAGTVFKGLALQSKKLGIEMSSLLSLTEQFDTFEGAANAAGQLNSLLGGPFLDSMQLMTAETEAQRVEMLKNSLQMAGKSWDSMNRFEKQAIASAAGISNMSDAAKLFGSASQQMAAEHKMLNLTQEEINERQQAGVDITKKLKLVVESLAVAVMPLVDMLSKGADMLVRFVSENQTLVQGFFMLASAVYVVRKAAMLYSVIQATIAAARGASIVAKTVEIAKNFLLARSMDATNSAQKKLDNTGKKSGKGIGKLGKQIGKLGIGMMKLAAAVLGIGIGIGIAAAGLALLVYSFTNLLKVIIANIGVMPQVTLAVLGLAAGFISLGAGFIVAGLGLAVFGAGFMAFVIMLGLGLLALSAMTPVATAASTALGIIALGVGGLALAMGGLAFSFDSIADQVNDVVSGMKELVGQDGLKSFVTVVRAIDEDNIGNLGKLIDETERLVMVQAQLQALEATQAIGNAINKLVSFVAPDPNGSSRDNKREIVLQINDREFGRAVVEALDGDMKLSLA